MADENADTGHCCRQRWGANVAPCEDTGANGGVGRCSALWNCAGTGGAGASMVEGVAHRQTGV